MVSKPLLLSAPKISFSIKIKQAQFLLLLLLKFKVLRIPLLVVALLLLPSNFWLLEVQSLAGGSEAQVTSRQIVTTENFPWNVLVSRDGNFSKQVANLQHIKTSENSKKDWLKICHSRESCGHQFFKEAHAEVTVKKIAHLSYSSRAGHYVECPNLAESDIVCPFLYQLMLRSLSSDGRLFHKVEFGSYTDTTDREITKSGDFNVLPSTKRKEHICDRVESTGRMGYTISITVLYHILIATAGCMVYFTASTIAFISGLKENGFLQLMFSNGLSVGAYWIVIILSAVLECAVFAAIIAPCYALQCANYFPEGSAVKFGLIFFAYCYSMVSLSLLLTVVLRTFYLIVVAIVAIIMAMVSTTVFGVINLGKMETFDYLMNALLLFPPGHVVQYSLFILKPSESTRWNDEQKYYLQRAQLAIFAFPIAVTLLTIYLDFLLSSGNGFRLPPTFVFSPRFWIHSVDVKSPAKMSIIIEDEDDSAPKIEPVPDGSPAISIKELSVRYNRGCCSLGNSDNVVQALDSVSCIIYKDQITALIGHNGAGKTTLIRTLTGELTPTSGEVIIGGRMVRDPYECVALRRVVSVCSQTNMLSQQLTVMESLKLAALSKGFTLESQLDNVAFMLAQLILDGKENVRAVDLSGGQLRKLCCIIALLGDPKIVMLDDPTRGLDPVSRRRLWRLMQELRYGRCLIMCTQFMDEADVLADRKLVLTGGRLICAGSSMFLKNLFGCCPTINVSLRQERKALPFIRSMPRGIQLLSQSGTELQLSVSVAGSGALSEMHLLATAVNKLEWHKGRKGSPIAAFGVSQASLDDIFTRIKDFDPMFVESGIQSRQLASMVRSSMIREPPKKVIGDLSLLRHNEVNAEGLRRSVGRTFAALMVMNLRRQVRSPVQAMCRFVMPLVLIAVVGVLASMEKNTYKRSVSFARNFIKDFHKIPSDVLIQSSKVQQAMAEAVRLPVLSIFATDNIICLYDTKDQRGAAMTACQAMAQNMLIFTIAPKGKGTVGDFLLPNNQLRPELEKVCEKSCYIIYSSSWNPQDSNAKRSISISHFWRKYRHEAAIKPMASYFSRFCQLFAPVDVTPRSVHMVSVVPLLQYSIIQNELIVLVLLISIIPVTFMSDPVEDRSACVRQQMKIMGLGGVPYWINTLVIHWIQYLTFAVLSTLVCMTWDRYLSSFLFLYVWLPIFLLGTVSNILCVYCIGAMQEIPSNSVLAIYLFFILFILSVVSFIMKSRIACALSTWLVPPLAPMILIFTAMKMVCYGLLYYNTEYTKDIPGLLETYLNYTDVRYALMAMGTHIVLLAILLVLTENWTTIKMTVKTCCTSNVSKGPKQQRKLREQDKKAVLLEAQRLLQNPRSNNNLLEVRNVEKVYPNGVYAVRGVTFGAMTGEIFGLLGQNGAGKTTLMSAIVGQLTATSGEVEVRHVDGDWLESHLGTHQGVIGFCPQHDPLFQRITVEEHMVFYARIRGVPEQIIMKQAERLIHGLGLVDDRFKPAKELSCGNKRSLCLAIALLGNPSVVVIDEASSGVDPEKKCGIWKAIRGLVVGRRRTVVVTTHSMEEVEALCSRLCIMDRGSMIGFGTVQQLRSQHGKAYTLDAFMSQTPNQAVLSMNKADLREVIQRQFPNSVVVDDVGSSIQFQIPTRSVSKLSTRILWLANNKEKLNVQYFSLHQMSLDQIFVNIMRQQAAAEYTRNAAGVSV